jgi:hypothetical protein
MHRAIPVSADRAAPAGPAHPREKPASRRGREKSSETWTLRWKEPDSNHRSCLSAHFVDAGELVGQCDRELVPVQPRRRRGEPRAKAISGPVVPTVDECSRGRAADLNGTKIVFTSHPPATGICMAPDCNYPDTEIYTINADGTGLTQLTHNNYEERAPAFVQEKSQDQLDLQTFWTPSETSWLLLLLNAASRRRGS